MSLKRFTALLMAVLCIATTLAGCGSTTTTQSTASSQTENDSGEHEPITIMDAQRDYGAFIELVHEKYPEINIEVLPYRGRNMSAYCKQQLETGIMPDIYSTTQAWDTALQKQYLVDLSQYAVSERYSAARLDEYTVDGGVYLLPFDFSITGMLVNKSLLERNGIEIPTSFAQLRDETVPALQAKGIKVADSLLDLPGSAFQYFFNVSAPQFMNTIGGRTWRQQFTDVDSDVFASDNEDIQACAKFFQQWIDLGMFVYNDITKEYSATVNDFIQGNTAFLVGTVKRFTQNDDGTGDRYALLPYLSEDGTTNTYITSPSRFYGLNKTLAEPGNEQKLEDALHVLEVLSTNEGYVAINGEGSTNMCSIVDFSVADDSPYAEAAQQVSLGHSMNQIYTGWDGYLVTFGEAVRDWIGGTKTGEEALAILDAQKKELQQQGTTYYATVTEELDTVQAAQLSGQMFMAATGADAALISYNVYSPDVAALMENSVGANGHILPGKLSEEYITIFLPTGWYDTLNTLEISGAQVMEMFNEGCDSRGTGYHYPYVLLTADGEPIDESRTYTVVVCGWNQSEKETLGLVDTGIVGLDAAKEYLLNVGEVSSATLDASMMQGISPIAQQ